MTTTAEAIPEITEPDPPFRLCTTLSGRRIHLTVPVRYHQITVCGEVVYEEISVVDAQGRLVCVPCEERRRR